jgi:adenylate kinase family enzyme
LIERSIVYFHCNKSQKNMIVTTLCIITFVLLTVSLFLLYFYHYNKNNLKNRLENNNDDELKQLLMRCKRINVIGSSGSGKSTLCTSLCKLLSIPHIELDSYKHGPNWEPVNNEIMKQQVSEAMDIANEFLIDGNYMFMRSVVFQRCELLIWLDYEYIVLYPRLLNRIFKRCFYKIKLWNDNVESWYTQFCTKESLLYWVWITHHTRREEIPKVTHDYPHLTVIRLTSPQETEYLLSHWQKLYSNS